MFLRRRIERTLTAMIAILIFLPFYHLGMLEGRSENEFMVFMAVIVAVAWVCMFCISSLFDNIFS